MISHLHLPVGHVALAAPGVGAAAGGAGAQAALPTNRFLQPVSACGAALDALLGELQADSWPVPAAHRAVRATGAALAIAVSLLECTYQTTGARVMLFMGGPCTHGAGLVVDDDLRNVIRSHKDILKDEARCALPFEH